MRAIKYLLFCFILVIPKSISFSQNNQISFSHLNVKDGLSQSWIRAICQDRRGFMWFGTGDGLNRYDGYEFKIYKNSPGRKNSISNNNIKKIFEDKNGNIWFGTQQGVNLYNWELDNIQPVSSTLRYSVEDINETKSGGLLIATSDGLFKLNAKNLTLEPLINGEFITAILNDKNGNIWLCSYNGLLLVDTVKFTYSVVPMKGIDFDYLQSIYQDSQGRIWLGTSNAGLILMEYNNTEPLTPEFTHFKHESGNKESIGQGSIYAILEDNKGKLWIGIENGDLNVLNLNNFDKKRAIFKHFINNISESFSISSNSIHSIYQDKHNTLWIGTYGGGINYYNDLMQKFKCYRQVVTNKNSLNDNHVNVLYNEKNKLWIGTERGLNILNKYDNSFQHYTFDSKNPHSIGSNAIWAIFRDTRNNMWVGTWAGGLNLFNENSKTFTRFKIDFENESTIGGNNIFRIVEDRRGQLWVASMSGGLSKFDYKTRTFKRFLHDNKNNSISSDWVSTIMESSLGELWIATTQTVDVLNLQTQKFITFRHDANKPGSISSNGAIALYEDSKGQIWIGTQGGLNLFNRKDSSFIYYREEDGLPNNTVNAICEDAHGNLWFSTNKGISKFINGLNVPKNPEFRNYDVRDGLQGNEFTRESVCKDEKGNIYFGGTNGYNVFHPDSLEDNPFKPEVVLSNFLIFNKPLEIGEENSPLKKNINIGDEITLTHKQSVFSIEFVALNYVATDKNQYAYMLEGFENNWNYVGSKRTATYTNLDAGKYIFKVKASNNDGLWNHSYTSLVINVLPPWWFSIWAKIAYALLFLTGLYFFRKYTLISVNFKKQLWLEHIEKEKSEELNRMKIQFFTNISHELRTPLSLILSPLEDLINKVDLKLEVKNQLRIVNRNAERLYRLVGDLMDYIKTDSNKLTLTVQPGNIVKFTHEVCSYFSDIFKRQQIDFQFSSDLETIEVWFDRDKLEKILQNLLSNAQKFTPLNGKISVIVKKTIIDQKNDKKYGKKEFVQISVIDNGPGISPDYIDKIFDRFYQAPENKNFNKSGTGIGLALTKSLVELHHGFIKVTSEKWTETCFSVFIPLGKEHFRPEEITNSPIDIDTHIIKKPSLDSIPSVKGVPVKTGGPVVLIVEDNFELREYIVSRLASNYTVIEAENGRVGFEKAVENCPDLIVSDIVMPEFSGIELCQKIKEEFVTSHIPFVLLTAKATIDDQIAGTETGADAYVTKPFNIKYLEVIIRKLIESRKKLFQRFSQEVYILPKEMTSNKMDEEFLEKTINYIHENVSNPNLSVDDIALFLSMSRSNAYRKIKALTGQSINDFIKLIRLKVAIKLLEERKLNISEIAFEVGFTSPAYFTKCFKDQFGKSPSLLYNK